MTPLRSDRGVARSLDWALIVSWLALVLTGVLCIYSASQGAEGGEGFNPGARYVKQLMWIGISMGATLLITFVIKPHVWEVLCTPAYIMVAVLLVAVIVFGSEINGSKSWFRLGPVAFQPSELSKITTSLVLAHYMRTPGFKITRFKDILMLAAIVGIPAVIILAQGETGTLLVYMSYAFVLYREGMSGWWLALIGAAIVLFIAAIRWPLWVAGILLTVMLVAYFLFCRIHGSRSFVARRNLWIVTALLAVAGAVYIYSTNFVFNNVLRPHQRSRIEVLLGITEDKMGAGYNVNQSMIAIGSGGLSGKGFLQGTQTSYGFVPEQCTDFIFCTVGEEFGFLGCAALILLFAFLIWRILHDAEASREPFTRIYGYCLAGCFFMHLMINVGMTIGLMPVIGIPLPFISYGGSSMLSFTVMLFIFVSLVRRDRKYF